MKDKIQRLVDELTGIFKAEGLSPTKQTQSESNGSYDLLTIGTIHLRNHSRA